MEQSPLSMFCFYQFGLCSVNFSYAANDSIYHVCIMIKDLTFLFQDFEIVTFNFMCIEADRLCCFLLNEKAGRFKSVQLSLHLIHFHSQTF